MSVFKCFGRSNDCVFPFTVAELSIYLPADFPDNVMVITFKVRNVRPTCLAAKKRRMGKVGAYMLRAN